MRNILDRYSKQTLLHFGLVIIIYVLSLFARDHFIKREFTDKGWVSAHVLMTVEIWDSEGISKFGFNPVYVYPNPGDKGISGLGGVKDADNRYYYVSYPPMTFYAAFSFFKLTGLEISEINLRLFNLLIHFFTGWILYLILLQLFNKTLRDPIYWPAFIGYMLYMFSSGTLLFHSEVYFADIIVQPFFLLQILFFLKWRKGRSKLDFAYLLFFSLIAIYTEWLGLFVLFVIFCLILVEKGFSFRQKFPFLAIIGGVTVFILTLLVWQYSSIDGWENLYASLSKKYQMRSGFSGKEASEYGFSLSNPESYSFLKGHYNKWFLPAINLIGIVSFMFLLGLVFLKDVRPSLQQGFILVLLIAPVMLHLFAFFNFNVVHDMGSLKVMTIAFILISLMVHRLNLGIHNLRIKYFLFVLIMPLTAFKCYQSIERYRAEMPLHFHGDFQKKIGALCKDVSMPEDIIMTNAFVVPELMFYCKRNIIGIPDTSEQRKRMLEWGVPSTLFFKVDGSNLKEAYRMDRIGDSIAVKVIPFPQ